LLAGDINPGSGCGGSLLPGWFNRIGGLAKLVYNDGDASHWMVLEQIAAAGRSLCKDEAASIE
jgi:hypothetical protein